MMQIIQFIHSNESNLAFFKAYNAMQKYHGSQRSKTQRNKALDGATFIDCIGAKQLLFNVNSFILLQISIATVSQLMLLVFFYFHLYVI